MLEVYKSNIVGYICGDVPWRKNWHQEQEDQPVRDPSQI